MPPIFIVCFLRMRSFTIASALTPGVDDGNQEKHFELI